MSEHLTEEEQVEQLKRLWKEYGQSIVLGAILALGSYAGYEGWNNHQQEKAEAASILYQELLDVASKPSLSDEQKATASHLAGQLKETYPDTYYANYAAMLAAKIAVQANELDKAVEELRWALTKKPEGSTANLLRTRLARLVAEQGDFAAAHKLVANTDDMAFSALYAEVRGDIYYLQQDFSAARTAYGQALSSLQGSDAGQRNLLEMKLNDLPVSDLTVSEAVVDSHEDAL